MNPIEPNLAALGWFAVFWSIGCLGFLQVAGGYPLGGRPSDASRLLVIGNSVLCLGLVAGSAVFAWGALRPTSIIVVGGLLMLFVPELFQSLPRRWRDGPGGLVVTAFALCFALAVLYGVGGATIATRL